jgi:hypothetical protein
MAAECFALAGLKRHMLLLLIEFLKVGTWHAYSCVSVNTIDHVSDVQAFDARVGQLSRTLRQ